MVINMQISEDRNDVGELFMEYKNEAFQTG